MEGAQTSAVGSLGSGGERGPDRAALKGHAQERPGQVLRTRHCLGHEVGSRGGLLSAGTEGRGA